MRELPESNSPSNEPSVSPARRWRGWAIGFVVFVGLVAAWPMYSGFDQYILDKSLENDAVAESDPQLALTQLDSIEWAAGWSTNLDNFLHAKANALSYAGRFDEAIEYRNQHLEIVDEADRTVAYFTRGNDLRSAGRHDEAIADYEKSMECIESIVGDDPVSLERVSGKIADLWVHIGQVELDRGNEDKARKIFLKAVSINEEVYEFHPWLKEALETTDAAPKESSIEQ